MALKLRNPERYSPAGWLTRTGVTALVILTLSWGCGVKRTVSVPVPPKVLNAKSATLDELLKLLTEKSQGLESLSSNDIRVTLTSGKAESGELQQYRSAPGYILLRRPDSFRMTIQNPITKTTIVELRSIGDEFSLWFPRENKYYMGRNSAEELEVEGDSGATAFSARPIHIFQAIFPEGLPLNQSYARIAMKEYQDSLAKYYVLSLFREMGGLQLRPLREIWIERSELRVQLERTYDAEGRIAGTVRYTDVAEEEGFLLPTSLRIDRPLDDYSLDMTFKSWRINRDLPDEAFALIPPPGAERVLLKEKKKRGSQ